MASRRRATRDARFFSMAAPKASMAVVVEVEVVVVVEVEGGSAGSRIFTPHIDPELELKLLSSITCIMCLCGLVTPLLLLELPMAMYSAGVLELELLLMYIICISLSYHGARDELELLELLDMSMWGGWLPELPMEDEL